MGFIDTALEQVGCGVYRHRLAGSRVWLLRIKQVLPVWSLADTGVEQVPRWVGVPDTG